MLSTVWVIPQLKNIPSPYESSVTAFLSFIFHPPALHAQEETPIQLHGIVVSNDSLKQLLPNVQILVKSRGQVSISDIDGFFSTVAMPGDTVFFQHIGFKLQKFWVADTLEGDEFLARIVLEWDTEVLDPVIVYPWPSKGKFQRRILSHGSADH